MHFDSAILAKGVVFLADKGTFPYAAGKQFYTLLITPFYILFNKSLVILNYLSAFFGTALALLVYFFTQKKYGTKVALLAFALFGLSFLNVWWSKSGLPYMAATFCVLLDLFFQQDKKYARYPKGLLMGLAITFHPATFIFLIALFLKEFVLNFSKGIKALFKNMLQILLAVAVFPLVIDLFIRVLRLFTYYDGGPAPGLGQFFSNANAFYNQSFLRELAGGLFYNGSAKVISFENLFYYLKGLHTFEGFFFLALAGMTLIYYFFTFKEISKEDKQFYFFFLFFPLAFYHLIALRGGLAVLRALMAIYPILIIFIAFNLVAMIENFKKVKSLFYLILGLIILLMSLNLKDMLLIRSVYPALSAEIKNYAQVGFDGNPYLIDTLFKGVSYVYRTEQPWQDSTYVKNRMTQTQFLKIKNALLISPILVSNKKVYKEYDFNTIDCDQIKTKIVVKKFYLYR